MLDRRERPPFPPEWSVPEGSIWTAGSRSRPYGIVIPVLNEGERIQAQLARMREAGIPGLADILVVDGGSTDGSLDRAILESQGVRALLLKEGPGRLGAQLRLAYAFALAEGYEGIVTVDGNNKDSVESVPLFLAELERGVDYVQGSRYRPGGRAVRTPWSRYLASRFVHAPLVSLAGKRRLTDTTNGFRAYSRNYLLHPRVQPFRDIFKGYELLVYLSMRAGQLGLRVCEVPVQRVYPPGAVPTKIRSFHAHFSLLADLLKALAGGYHPPPEKRKP